MEFDDYENTEEDVYDAITTNNDNDDNDISDLIGHMKVSMIKERTPEQEYELVTKYYKILADLLITNGYIVESKSRLYLDVLRRDLLEVFETYIHMFDILMSEMNPEEQKNRREYSISILNKDLYNNGRYSCDFDFLHNSYLLFGSIIALIDDYNKYEKENKVKYEEVTDMDL